MSPARTVAMAALAGLLLGCGVTADPQPRRLGEFSIPVPTLSAEGAVVQPTAIIVYLIADDSVVAVHRVVDGPATPARRLAALGRGPTDREVAAGLRTALAGGIRAEDVRVSGGTATVELAQGFTGAGTQEQILALAQVVFTLTDVAEVDRVGFVIGARAVSVPRADGSLTSTAVLRQDYAALLRSRR